ncbi:MAG: cache domain-containing protein [Anaeromicrobium sp.]|jgi:hypothetical protein|uniref:SpoIIE family protein phosphatase n=1 Tax=Anaeromicrobium sp. TaxID=1929132 RepID=UPI0025CF3A38|nr:SpoIIE family protein phosphatase [Anaeromicrobium sp.]MCT4595499.1 cache domain-containing protein [Anaeromicrobium sp.]
MGVLVSSISLFTNFNLLKKEVIRKLTLLPQTYSNDFNSDFQMIESSVNTLHHYVAATYDLEKMNRNPKAYIKEYESMMDAVIKKVAEEANTEQGLYTTNQIEAVYFTFNPQLTKDVHEIWYVDMSGNGKMIKLDPDPDPDSEDSYIEYFYPDNKEMKWYYDPIKMRKGVWSEPYDEGDLGIKVISYTEPIYIENVVVGVVGMDINIEVMKNTIKKLKIYDTGYAFLMNKEYEFVIHPIFNGEEDLNSIHNGRLKYISEEMDKNTSGVINYEYDGKVKMLGYSHLNSGWILGFTVPIVEVYSSLRIQLIMTLMALFISMGITFLIALYLGKSISEPIVKITQLIKRTSRFNFMNNHCLEPLMGNKNEIGIMAKEMFNMRKVLKETGVHKAAIWQRQSLQEKFPLANRVNMETIYVPSKTVSGDFYRMQKIDDNMVVGVIYDVSGKGVTAALNTSAFSVLFHESVVTSQNPINIIHDLNNKVANFFDETYIAACCFSFDFKRNIAKIAGAGLNEFIYGNEEYYEKKYIKGPFLGMFEDSIFDQETIHFQSNDRFYFFTDGLESVFDDETIKEKYLKKESIGEFKKNLKNILINKSTDMQGIDDDCTLLIFEIK